MDQNLVRKWKILCWNIRGLNAEEKWNAVKNKVINSNCDIVCLQETKMDHFDMAFLKKILPPAFDDFAFIPAVGASGGLLVAWKSSLFSGLVKLTTGFAIAIELTATIDNTSWTLLNVYGPCSAEGKLEFSRWIKSLTFSDEDLWLILGDFNLYRYPENRNKEGANVSDMFLFNNTISYMGWTEIPVQGNKFTWSNMQSSPLLEKLDWVFTSNA